MSTRFAAGRTCKAASDTCDVSIAIKRSSSHSSRQTGSSAVLTEGAGPTPNLLPLYPEAVALLEDALDLEILADQTTPPPQRNALLRRAAALKTEARDLILLPPLS